MKNVLFVVFIAVVGISQSFSQEIKIEKKFWGYEFYENGNKLSAGELLARLESVEESASLVQKTKTNYIFSTAFAGAGGGLIGYTLGYSIAGGDFEWEIAAVGAGLVGVAIPFAIIGNRNLREAVEIYNSTEDVGSLTEFHIIANGNGVGLGIRF